METGDGRCVREDEGSTCKEKTLRSIHGRGDHRAPTRRTPLRPSDPRRHTHADQRMLSKAIEEISLRLQTVVSAPEQSWPRSAKAATHVGHTTDKKGARVGHPDTRKT
eukprot:3488326-Rhodomonas_salina.4